MDNNRIVELEKMLNCSILEPVKKGYSLEKYRGKFGNHEVLIRIYNDDYYTNRFLREGMILRKLDNSSSQVVFPKIIEEWPEYQIRAIEWFDFDYKPVSQSDATNVISWIQEQQFNLPYSLKDDLIPHLLNIQSLHPAYRQFFEEHLDEILNELEWDEGKATLIHGDLHNDNMGYVDDQLVVYDWEYGTFGSEFYDPAYYAVSTFNLNANVPITWLYLASLVNCHWFLQEDKFSPKEAIEWVNFVGEISKQIE